MIKLSPVKQIKDAIINYIFLVNHNDPFIIDIHSYGCQRPGEARIQIIDINHGLDLVLPECGGLSTSDASSEAQWRIYT